jgi:multidrug efflux pump subunit AcrB
LLRRAAVGYRRTQDIVLRHQAIALAVFFGTLALTIVIAIQIPRGFFPLQDTGLIMAVSEGGQDISPDRMIGLQRKLGDVILSDPDVQAFVSQTGNNDNPTMANTGKFSIVLKPRGERKSTASQVSFNAAVGWRWRTAGSAPSRRRFVRNRHYRNRAADRYRQEERHHARRFCDRCRTPSGHAFA